jgi:large subunit ribosomal protein L5
MTTETVQAPPVPRLKARYREEIAPALREEFGYRNVMQIPGLVKIVVNMGVGEAARDAKLIEGAVKDLSTITGQKPAVARAKRSVAQFKLREGMPIGAHTTLRGDRMWEFLDRLLTIALPRIRDFRPRPPAHDRAPPDPRLPRPVRQAVRRSRELHVRPDRAGHVP